MHVYQSRRQGALGSQCVSIVVVVAVVVFVSVVMATVRAFVSIKLTLVVAVVLITRRSDCFKQVRTIFGDTITDPEESHNPYCNSLE